jgi:hypothetical protein
MFDRLLSLLAAVSLAFLVWLYARSRDPEVLDNVPVPVQVVLSPEQAGRYDVEVTGPSQVPVSFRGPSSRIRELRRLLQEGGLRVDVTLVVPDDRKNESRYLDTVRVDAADVHAPPGVTVLIVDGRNRIPVTLRRLVQRRLPVRLDPPPDERVSQASLEPDTVLVRGPKVVLDRVRSIPTQVYLSAPGADVAPDQESVTEAAVPLVRELDGRPVAPAPEAVTVRLTFRPRERIYQLADLPVEFLCPADFPLRPRFADEGAGKVNLRVAGPAGEEPPRVLAFVDLTRGPRRPGVYVDQPLRLQLPWEFRLAQDRPHAGPFELIPTADVPERATRSAARGR